MLRKTYYIGKSTIYKAYNFSQKPSENIPSYN